MQSLLLASTNRGKLIELTALLAELHHVPIRLVTPADLDLRLQVTEDGLTYAENAAKKAQVFCRASGLVTLGDDSGLEVEALEGRPGLHSARYSPLPGAGDAERRARLLDELRPHPRPWTARFCCVVAIALPDETLYSSKGVCPGEIIPEERGHNGFGYDPIFLVAGLPGAPRTMAELDMQEKNQVSHRARAVRGTFQILKRLFK